MQGYDDYNADRRHAVITTEQRKTEQYAAITESGRLARQIYEMQQDGGAITVVAPLIERRAQLEIDIFRIGNEINTEVMTSNLVRFLEAGDARQVEIKTLLEENNARLGKIERDIRALNKRHGAQIKEAMRRIEAIEKVLAERPSQRAAERRALLKAIRDGHAE